MRDVAVIPSHASSNNIAEVESLVHGMYRKKSQMETNYLQSYRLKRGIQTTPLSCEPSPSSGPNASQSINQHRPMDLPIANPDPLFQDDIEMETASRNSGWGTPGLQPVSILSKEAQFGKFSLENILCVPDVHEPSLAAAPAPGDRRDASNRDDPITCYILTFPVALGLFEKLGNRWHHDSDC